MQTFPAPSCGPEHFAPSASSEALRGHEREAAEWKNARQLAFYHIPECGGTSFLGALQKVLGGQNPTFFADLNYNEQMQAFLDLPAEQRHAPLLVHSHMPGRLRGLLHPSAKVVSVVRDPMQRAISGYYWNRRHRGQGLFWVPEAIEQGVSLREWVEGAGHGHILHDTLTAQLDRLRRDPLEDPPNTYPSDPRFVLDVADAEMDFLGCTEFFDESLFIIATLLGLSRIPKWQRAGSASPPDRGDLDPAIIRKLEKLLEVDLALYQLCRKRFLDRYGDMVSYFRENVGSLELTSFKAAVVNEVKTKTGDRQPTPIEKSANCVRPSLVVDLNGRNRSDRRAPLLDLLRTGSVAVFRDMPEVHALGDTIRAQAAKLCEPNSAAGVADLFRTGKSRDLETYSAIYRIFRSLRDSRYLSSLFSDFVDGLDLPKPVLIDSGYCRMLAPQLIDRANNHPELFDATEFQPRDPSDSEQMLQGQMWGNAHRDIDTRHYHFQINLWFPLHDLDETQTLLLFPDAYRGDVAQYGKLPDADDPSGWGFGQALQVPLKFGDVLVFHSQQLHASPSQSLTKDRFTVEIRVASGCIDDNSRIYRRIFWSLPNFKPRHDGVGGASMLAEQLTEPAHDPFDIDHVLAGQTAHAVVHRLFRTASASLSAGFLRRPDSVLNDAFSLDESSWSRVLDRLDGLLCGEDLLLLVARLLLRQGYLTKGTDLLRKISDRTKSYFWALEVGFFAANAQSYGLAENAFERAERLANLSDVALDRYTCDMPPPRSQGLLQLLPASAARIARHFVHRIQTGQTTNGGMLDHRDLWDSTLATSVSVSNEQVHKLPVLVDSYRGYNVVKRESLVGHDADFVAVRQSFGDVRLFEETLGQRQIEPDILTGRSLDELRSKIDIAAKPPPAVPVSVRWLQFGAPWLRLWRK